MSDMLAHPLISVIVPVFNDIDGLRRCLEALDRQTLPKSNFEVVIVDNGSHQPIAPMVMTFNFARCVIEEKRGSYAARNTGVRIATGALLAFTDADCQPRPDWLEQASKIFDFEKTVSAIGGIIELELSIARTAAELHESVLSPFPQEQLIALGQFAATANLVVRASVFEEVGPFNEDLLSAGDREWGNRLIAAGFQLRYSEECAVLHPARKTIRSMINRRRRIMGGALGLASIRPSSEVTAYPRIYPSRRRLLFDLIVKPQKFNLERVEGLKVLALAGLLVAVRITEGLRLRLGGQPVR
jgi:glycosyltransferase involved in cell wall biosynthesis